MSEYFEYQGRRYYLEGTQPEPPTQGDRVTRFGRIRHDFNPPVPAMRYSGALCRMLAPDYPFNLPKQRDEGFKAYALPKKSSGELRTDMTGGWRELSEKVNGYNKQAINWLCGDTAQMVFNGDPPEWSKQWSVYGGGNVIRLGAWQQGYDDADGSHEGYYEIIGLDRSQGATPFMDYTYETNPLEIHYCTNIRVDAEDQPHLAKPPVGDVFYVNAPKSRPWIFAYQVEISPALPMSVVAGGAQYQIVSYELRGGDVYGWTADEQRIGLRINHAHPTNWFMQVESPPVG